MADNKDPKKPKQQEVQNQVLKEIADRDLAANSVVVTSGIFIGLMLVLMFQAGSSMIKMLSDRSLPVVVCPRDFNLDAPVVMKTIKQEGLRGEDRWLRGFTRRILLNQFPRNEKDVEPFFTYMLNHSKGDIQKKFKALLKDKTDISDMIRNDFYYRFYPRNSLDVRIRAVPDHTDQWIIEVDGYLVKKMSTIQERYTPTLHYTVESGIANIDNPEGLYIIDGNIEQITDYVSGRKENL